MRALATMLISTGVLFLSAACERGGGTSVAEPPAPATTTVLSPEESAAAREALVAWFECDECTDGELERVSRYGDAVVPNLAGALERGLAPSKREEAKLRLVEAYRGLTEYAKERKEEPIPMSEQEYVDTYLGNLETLYRVRAAVALNRIGTPAARETLDRGLKADLSPELRSRIDTEIKRSNK